MEEINDNKKNNRLKNIFTTQNLLCLFVILSPIFDIASFLFRNTFKTNISISTVLRPIIPLGVLLYIFIKTNNKNKIKLFIMGLIYAVYAICHLLVFNSLLTRSSFGGIESELQYLSNFTFIMIDFVVYYYVFKIQKDDEEYKIARKKEGLENLKKAVTIMLAIYVGSIFLSIITKTSSYTYGETKTGYKGWIESGNSLSAILCLGLFVAFAQTKSKNIKWKIFSIITIALTGIYLSFVIGTRTGLLGFFIVLAIFILCEVIFSKNKKILITGVSILVIGVLGITIFGSKTLQRRKQINEVAENNVDQTTGEKLNMSLGMMEIYNNIMNGTLEEGYMSDAQQEAIVELHEYTKEHDIASNNNRKQQLLYNIFLVKHQKNPMAIIFGNGYNTNPGEMCMENEIPAFILNFGIIGFILFASIFIIIFIKGLIIAFKHIKDTNTEYMMYLTGSGLSLILATVSGFVFFATSSMLVIVVTNILLINQMYKLEN